MWFSAPHFFDPINPPRILISIFASQVKGPYKMSHSHAVATPPCMTDSCSYMTANLVWRWHGEDDAVVFPFTQKTYLGRCGSCTSFLRYDKLIERYNKYLHLSNKGPLRDIPLASCGNATAHNCLWFIHGCPTHVETGGKDEVIPFPLYPKNKPQKIELCAHRSDKLSI